MHTFEINDEKRITLLDYSGWMGLNLMSGGERSHDIT